MVKINKKENARKKKFYTFNKELGETVKILDLQDLKRSRDFLKKYL